MSSSRFLNVIFLFFVSDIVVQTPQPTVIYCNFFSEGVPKLYRVTDLRCLDLLKTFRSTAGNNETTAPVVFQAKLYGRSFLAPVNYGAQHETAELNHVWIRNRTIIFTTLCGDCRWRGQSNVISGPYKICFLQRSSALKLPHHHSFSDRCSNRRFHTASEFNQNKI